ncbi:MAG TPA: ParB N-terminal domain-containing protein [Chitinophagaceae bacterium]|nr:ParB N-terminal domain-containing protein [Chitinophagaceae bacterium]
MKSKITWQPQKVKVSDLKENPNNPKISSEVGKKRLQLSLSKFGLAGTIVVNKDLSVIDGHSRKRELENEGIKEVWVSVPSKQLTEKEYKEFNAIHDLAKAGEPDMIMTEEILGEEIMEEYGFEKKDKKAIKEVELVPFEKTHVLISFPPEKMIKLQPLLQKIADMDGVEFEQSSN